MNGTALRASEAARRLGMTTKELLALIHAREIDFVMENGIAHVPESAIEKYRATSKR